MGFRQDGWGMEGPDETTFYQLDIPYYTHYNNGGHAPLVSMIQQLLGSSYISSLSFCDLDMSYL